MTTPSIGHLQLLWSSRAYSTSAASRAAIDLLADGRPVTTEALAAATGMTVDEAQAFVESAHRSGAEVEDGAVVGLALSLRPTRHRFRVRGHDLYTWCGFDALFLPISLAERADVASTCPVTGADIQLRVEPDGAVTDAVPATAVVGIVGEEVTSCWTVAGPDSAICTQMPLFASRDAAESWLADHPGVAIVDLGQAREIARAYVLGPKE